MKKTMIVLSMFLGLSFGAFAAEEGMLPATPYAQIPVMGAKMIEFGATSCRSCQAMDRLLYSLKKENPALPLFFVNVMKDREAAAKFRIRMIPTQVFIDKTGKVVATHIGKLSRDELLQWLRKYGIAQ
ncbi:thioredoxin family protein [Nitratifractor sp.]